MSAVRVMRTYSPPKAVNRAASHRESGEANKRWQDRLETSIVGVITYNGARCSTSCIVLDISRGGAQLQLDAEDWVNPVSSAHGLPGNFKLVVQSLGFEVDCQVAWRNKSKVGVRFLGKIRQMPRQFRKPRSPLDDEFFDL